LNLTKLEFEQIYNLNTIYKKKAKRKKAQPYWAGPPESTFRRRPGNGRKERRVGAPTKRPDLKRSTLTRCPAHAQAPHAATPRAVVSHRPRVRAARGSATPPPPSYPAIEATAAGSLDHCSAASTKLQTHTPAHLPRRRRRDGQRALAGEQAAQDPLRLQGLPPLAQDRYSNYS
jgi:hypothetical protein